MKLRYTLLPIILFCYGVTAQNPTHSSPKKRTFPEYLNGKERQTAELYQKVIPTVVTIYTSTQNITQKGPIQNQGLGSGVLISHNCHILTAAHVVDGASKIKVKTHDGELRDATVLFSEKTADLALLKLDVPDHSLAHAMLGDSDVMAIGQQVFAIGSPYGLENSFSAGIVSAFRGFNQLYNGSVSLEFIQTDAAINSGNSGGPLFNSQGEVIGIASSILSVSGGFQGIGMAVTINTAKDLLAFEDRPWIGIDGVLLQREDFVKVFNLDIPGGLLVQKVAKGSPANKAGIRGGTIPAKVNGRDILFGGDIVLEIGKQVACHVGCLENATKQLKSEDVLNIRYLRGGKEQFATLDVSEVRKNFFSNK